MAATRETDPASMRVYKQAPSPTLRPLIQRFLVVEFPAFHSDIHLPDTGSVAAFSLQGQCRIGEGRQVPSAAFTGLYETLRYHEHSRGHTVVLATFTPAGAAAFLNPPQEEFAGTTTDLADILARPGSLGQLQEQLAEAPDHGRRIELLEGFLLARARSYEPDPLVAAAVAWLERGAKARRIDDLTRYIGLSQSALERRFRRVVGISPKRFASLVRLRHAMRLQSSGADYTTIAQAAGYFDQSHFIKDFRRAIGSAPEAFFGRARETPNSYNWP